MYGKKSKTKQDEPGQGTDSYRQAPPEELQPEQETPEIEETCRPIPKTPSE